MPIKSDESGKRWVEMDILVPGTPEQVWQAIATGPGNSAWFTKTEIEEKSGGRLAFDFGTPDMKSEGEVTLWEPPYRFGYQESDWCKGAPPVATEITITSRSGDQCLVRMVHSLFTSSEDWDDQVEGFESGWPVFFEILRLYLGHFAGQKAASAQVMTRLTDDLSQGWKRLTQALQLASLDAGDRVTTSSSPQSLTGVVERVHQTLKQRQILLRLDSPSSGVALIDAFEAGAAAHARVGLYFYGENASVLAEKSKAIWTEWFDKVFPSH